MSARVWDFGKEVGARANGESRSGDSGITHELASILVDGFGSPTVTLTRSTCVPARLRATRHTKRGRISTVGVASKSVTLPNTAATYASCSAAVRMRSAQAFDSRVRIGR